MPNVGSHHALPGGGGEQEHQGLRDVVVPVDVAQRPARVGKDRERPAAADEVAHPIVTFAAPETIALVSRSVGSLQVRTGSPSRAAALPLIVTVVEPWLTVPLFDGGD